jgi:replicative DNA helicase
MSVDDTTDNRITPLRESDNPPPGKPNNIEAEQALLGAIFVNNLAYGAVSDFLCDEHFSNPLHGRIYHASSQLIEGHDAANPITLRALFENDTSLIQAGGIGYLAKLAACAVTVINAPTYGRIIHDLALRRQGLRLAEQLTLDLHAVVHERPADTIFAAHDEEMFALRESAAQKRPYVSLGQAMQLALEQTERAYKRGGALAGLTTGLADLDKALGGLRAGELVVIAAATSMGKTALALNIADSLARLGYPTGIFALEQSAAELTQRIMTRHSKVSLSKQLSGDLDMIEWNALAAAQDELRSVPLWVDDTSAASLAHIRHLARAWKKQRGIRMLVVDHLQLMRSPEAKGYPNRAQEVAEYTGGLKALAKDLEIPVLLLSQLRRGIEQRENKRPGLADLRESGSIEQDADVVIFLYREEYYLINAHPSQREREPISDFNDRVDAWKAHLDKVAGTAEAIIAKHRQGATATIKLGWNAALTEFTNFAAADRWAAQTY